jgi:hypothetical protein
MGEGSEAVGLFKRLELRPSPAIPAFSTPVRSSGFVALADQAGACRRWNVRSLPDFVYSRMVSKMEFRESAPPEYSWNGMLPREKLPDCPAEKSRAPAIGSASEGRPSPPTR